MEKHSPVEVQGESLRLAGLQPGPYQIEWWDTRQGRVASRGSANVSRGVLDLPIPAFTRDTAVKVVRR